MMLHRHLEELARQQEAEKAAEQKAEARKAEDAPAEEKQPKRTRKSK